MARDWQTGIVLSLIGMVFLSAPALARDKTSSKDSKLSAAYAEHVYTSTCSHEYREKFPVFSLTEKDRQQLYKHAADACSCLYKAVARSATPDVIVDYVMYTKESVRSPQKGGTSSGQQTYPQGGYRPPAEFQPIEQALINPDTKKKCGFVR